MRSLVTSHGVEMSNKIEYDKKFRDALEYGKQYGLKYSFSAMQQPKIGLTISKRVDGYNKEITVDPDAVDLQEVIDNFIKEYCK